MRSLILLIALGAFALPASAQTWKISTAYSLGLPQSTMKSNIQADHSLQGSLLYAVPGTKHRVLLGAELGLGLYASKRIDQTFQFDNNTTSIVPVNYTSNSFNASLGSRFNLLGDRNLIIPYLSLKGGLYNLFSTVVIEDPKNPDGCHALDRKNIINDATGYFAAGGGLQIDAALFTRVKHRGNVHIDLSIQSVRGGEISYINTRHLVDAQTMNNPEGKPLEVQFVSASTQAIHEHTVAQVFTTPLRLLEFRVGVVAALGW